MVNIISNLEAEKEVYKDIKKILYKIKYCKSKSSFEQLTEELNSLYLLCDEFDLFDALDYEKYISRSITVEDNILKMRYYLSESKKFIDYISKNIEHFLTFSDQKDLFKDLYYDSNTTHLNKITDINEIIEYAYEFMKDYDKRFIESFNLLNDKNHLLISKKNIFDLYEGVFIPNRYCAYPYIGIFLNENIDDSSSIVHEVAHMINHNYAKNNFKTRNYPYYYHEVYSHYIQFVFYEYIKRKNMYIEDIDNSFKSCLFLLGNNLESINYILESDECFNYEDLFYDIQYGYGIAIALKYLDIYKYDPEKAKYLTNQFIEQSYYYEPIEILNKFGLDEDELINGKLIKNYLK